jgi:hypothetical protein
MGELLGELLTKLNQVRIVMDSLSVGVLIDIIPVSAKLLVVP